VQRPHLLLVLLALTYLVAYFTPVKLGWRVLMMVAVIPLALLTNATRLTLILLFGYHGNAALAKLVHDNEGPVLIFFCSLVLMDYANSCWPGCRVQRHRKVRTMLRFRLLILNATCC